MAIHQRSTPPLPWGRGRTKLVDTPPRKVLDGAQQKGEGGEQKVQLAYNSTCTTVVRHLGQESPVI
jgi:hypothetical protein